MSDHGLHGFKRYVGLAIVARNIQKLGSDLLQNTRQQEKRKRDRDKLAAYNLTINSNVIKNRLQYRWHYHG